MITEKYRNYDFTDCTFGKPAEKLGKEFVLRVKLKEKAPEGDLITWPVGLKLVCRKITEKEASEGWNRNEDYISYLENGEATVLELSIYVHSPYHPERVEMKLGIPLTVYDLTEKPLYILYNGYHLEMVYDGVLINENWPVGVIRFHTAPVLHDDLCEVSYSEDRAKVLITEAERTTDRSVRYFAPTGHNAWAGDAVNFWHDGVYHLLYLIDRHHHGHRWGGGSHTFCHMTTTDFVNWVDYGPMMDLEADWQSTGTGTMFFWNGDYYLAHGFHTDRVLPEEFLVGARMRSEWEKRGESRTCSYEEIASQGRTPNGANLLKSHDGIHWERIPVVFHWAENPSVHTEPDGTLRMYVCCDGGDGTWAADNPLGPWKLINDSFPAMGAGTPMKNTAECPSFFEKDGYKYLIMGLSGFWQTEKNGTVYMDMAGKGIDVYDGLVVPMAVNCDGRLIIAGWLNGMGWKRSFGSVIVQRELVQEPDGRLKMRWLPETEPVKKALLHDSAEVLQLPLDPVGTELLELEVSPGEKPVSVIFGEEAELRIDPLRQEMQIGPVGGERILPAYEGVKKLDAEESSPWAIENLPSYTENFCLGFVEEAAEPFRLRIIRHWNAKMHCTLIDVELSGKRTLISNRPDVTVDRVSVDAGDGKVTSFRVWEAEV